MSSRLQTIAIPATVDPPAGLIVALHGWGANAQDLASLSPYLNLPQLRQVFPNAPFPHPYNSIGRMWYGFPANFSFHSTPDFENTAELSTSRQLLTDLLKSLEQETGVPLSRTILAGFSQGGAMTLDVGMQLPLAGLMVLSGYLHAPLKLQPTPPPPILVVHGRQDTVVPLQSAHETRAALLARGAALTYQEFDMGHDIQPAVLSSMQAFISQVLP